MKIIKFAATILCVISSWNAVLSQPKFDAMFKRMMEEHRSFYYQQKSRIETTRGLEFLGTGLVLTTYGIIAYNNEWNLDGGGGEGIIAVIGMCSILVSIPHFISAAKNRRIAVLTRTEKITVSSMQNSGKHRSVGIGIQIGNWEKHYY